MSSAIRWRPTHDTYYFVAALRTATNLPVLCVTQTALLRLESAIQESRIGVPYGALAGQFCVCPETGSEFLLVDEVMPATAELTERDFADRLRAELRSLARQATKRGKLPIGWYISGTGDDLRLDEEDMDLHRQLWPEAWQFVLLHDGVGEAQRAALMRYEPMTKRLYATPFFELPDTAAVGPSDSDTVLRWNNYRSDQQPEPRSAEEAEPVRGRAKHSVTSDTVSPIEILREPDVPRPPAIPARPPANARLVFIDGEIVAFSDEPRHSAR